ncbi:SDR family NAD(P)-dependent oxidoreductase [Blastomonas sp.]|uniref:SDR family NAD(P)-dependent oxidoreductase n=1 Tax=Blastomonas sp. TaxID=1909299 RepID=UPI00406A25D3
MSKLTDRIALVTGAASGIGKATAIRFAEAGATLVLADRNAEALATALAELDDPRHLSCLLDVTDEAGWAELAATIETAFGRLDVLVNNAGYGAFRSIAETTLEEWRAIMAVNLDSVFLGTRAMLPLLAKSRVGGSIINMSSIRGIAGAPFAGSYCAAKGGVRLFTKAAALECAALGNGVRVNSIHPGHVLTPLTSRVHDDPEQAAKLLADTPMGRAGDPDEIAAAMLFLAGDGSRYMTGSELVVDGGSTAQ